MNEVASRVAIYCIVIFLGYFRSEEGDLSINVPLFAIVQGEEGVLKLGNFEV